MQVKAEEKEIESQNSERRISRYEELADRKFSHSYQLVDAINNTSIAIICSNTSDEFDDWIKTMDVEGTLIEINNACTASS